MKTVYLAGPITGLNYMGAVGWRTIVEASLKDVGIKAYSPMRAKEYLQNFASFDKGYNNDFFKGIEVMSTNKGITVRDRYDAMHCDVLFVNFLGATSVSIGTVIELGWTDACRTPIVAAMEDEGNPHDHGMIKELIGFRVNNLEDAIHITKSILL